MNLSKIRRDIEKLKAKQGICRCQNVSRIYFTPSVLTGQNEEKPPDVCPECRGRIQALQIIYVTNWRSPQDELRERGLI